MRMRKGEAMKKRAVLLCFLSAILMLLQGCHKSAPVIPDAALSSFSFSENNSYFKRIQGYEYRLEEGRSVAYFLIADEEEAYPVPVDQAWVDALTGFIHQHGMMAWDGFQGSDSMLLDGTQFSLNFAFADGTTVHASGYGIFPVNYGNASSAIEAHFMQLLPQNMRTW